MFKGHSKGLYALALANTGERFGYYTMLASPAELKAKGYLGMLKT